jgi:hypothetical protein
MRARRRRTKKLIVAFHFQFANQAGWKCDTCRAQGLERKRRCAWVEGSDAAPPQTPVWARRQARAPHCPKSYITAESLDLLARFRARRTFGFGEVMALPAREVDAFCLLENELISESRNEQR